MIRTLIRLVAIRISRLRERRRKDWIERLCARGMRLGRNVVIMDDVSFDASYPWLIEIGDRCRISTGVRILAHDATPLRDLGISRLGRVRILSDTFIAERCIILPGVTIGPGAMVAAGSVVSRDIGKGALAAGNPARVYGRYGEYLDRLSSAAASSLIVDVQGIADDQAKQSAVLNAMDAGEQVLVRGIDSDMSYFYNVDRADVIADAANAYLLMKRNSTAPTADGPAPTGEIDA